MATATHAIFGYSGSLGGVISARSRREPKYSKQKQTRMIHAILSRRMMSPPPYEEVLDYVDSQVTYAENKREVLAVFGERSRKGRMIADKDMRDMYCNSLHNQCVSNGLETCQTACDECKTPAACEKAEQIKKEIKKHGRKLTHFERLETERAKEAKRKAKKAKYSTGQTVKCREGYELQCGFSGSRKITQVKRYPDYVMYGIKGKAQGFVEEDWIVGVKATKKVVKKKKERKDFEEYGKSIDQHAKDMQKAISQDMREKGLKWSSRKSAWVDIKTGLTASEAFLKKKKAKPPKPRPAKATKTPKKVKKIKPAKAPKPPKKTKTTKPSKPSSQIKTLTKNQQALLRKYRFVDVSIQGKMYHITKQNVKDGKVEWYKKNGKVCLKNRGW